MWLYTVEFADGGGYLSNGWDVGRGTSPTPPQLGGFTQDESRPQATQTEGRLTMTRLKLSVDSDGGGEEIGAGKIMGKCVTQNLH
jgi:hypothetical protein